MLIYLSNKDQLPMNENLSQYHPVIEELVVTEGQDAGRIKDRKFAQELAIDLDDARETEAEILDGIRNTEPSKRAEWMKDKQPSSQEVWSKHDREYVAEEIAKKVMEVQHEGRYLEPIQAGLIVGEQLTQIKHRNG